MLDDSLDDLLGSPVRREPVTPPASYAPVRAILTVDGCLLAGALIVILHIVFFH